MTSQPRHNLEASQAANGADDITTLQFKTQIHSLSICGPQAGRYSYLLLKAGVPNFFLLAFTKTSCFVIVS